MFNAPMGLRRNDETMINKKSKNTPQCPSNQETENNKLKTVKAAIMDVVEILRDGN